MDWSVDVKNVECLSNWIDNPDETDKLMPFGGYRFVS